MSHETRHDEGLFGANMILFESLDSTNTWAMQNAADLHNGDVIQTMSQTAGRGRFSRTWVTPPNTCLTLSIVLTFPNRDDPLMLQTTQLAALALQTTLQKHGLHALLKWPNDVLVNNRKIAGILAEYHEASSRLILGIGLNVNLSEDDLDNLSMTQPATSMAILKGHPFTIDDVRKQLLRQFTELMSRARHEGIEFLHRSWLMHDALTGRTITVNSGDDSVTGDYAGIDMEGRLVLAGADGHRQTFWSGDVTLQPL